MSAYKKPISNPYVVAVNISAGGIPKCPQKRARVLAAGLFGDGRNHAKHNRPDRAICLWDLEILRQLVAEGFALAPGAAGENLTVSGLKVQQMLPGALLKIDNVIVKLEQPRKPCYVLDAIDPRLKDAIVGRCGYMASIVREGWLRPGMLIEVLTHEVSKVLPGPCNDGIAWDAAQIALAQHLDV